MANVITHNWRTDRRRGFKLGANYWRGVDACGILCRSVGPTNRKYKYGGHSAYKMQKSRETSPNRRNFAFWQEIIVKKLNRLKHLVRTTVAESHNSEVTTLWRYTNLFIIIIIINMKKALLLSSTSPFSQCNSAFCVRGNCACAESRDAWVGGQKRLHFWNPRPRFAYSLYNFYWATTTIKGRLLWCVTNAKALDCVNVLCVTVWPWLLNV